MIPANERPCIYISGPITKGDRNDNYHQSLKLQKTLMLEGFAPFNPMMTMVVPFAWEDCMPHDLWLACDYPWIAKTDAVFRLWGESDGANKETDFADQLGIPVFTSKQKLVHWRRHIWLPQQTTTPFKPNPTQTLKNTNDMKEESPEESSSTKNKRQNSKPRLADPKNQIKSQLHLYKP